MTTAEVTTKIVRKVEISGMTSHALVRLYIELPRLADISVQADAVDTDVHALAQYYELGPPQHEHHEVDAEVRYIIKQAYDMCLANDIEEVTFCR